MRGTVYSTHHDLSSKNRHLSIALDLIKLHWSVMRASEACRKMMERSPQEAHIPIQPQSGFEAISRLLIKGSGTTRWSG
jgi:hypothetical protein